ncbi:syntaxin, Qa-SNARE family [Hepatocystis sp. ex Piliocolobus tephrosceles]|nr:syntaxin, Qa-SNARE family [Hepatocystis sp. ex Piliocolobus tephrosceles]
MEDILDEIISISKKKKKKEEERAVVKGKLNKKKSNTNIYTEKQYEKNYGTNNYNSNENKKKGLIKNKSTWDISTTCSSIEGVNYNDRNGDDKTYSNNENNSNEDSSSDESSSDESSSDESSSDERSSDNNDKNNNIYDKDYIQIEKKNIFSTIINNTKSHESESLLYYKDIEKNADETTPLFLNKQTLNNYLVTVNDINTNISNIYKNIDKINVIKKKIDLNIYDNEKLYTKINVIINNSEEIVKYIKIKINALNEENENFEKNNTMVSEIKLRINIFIDVVNKYKTCINKYKNICNQYYEHVNKNVIKHYKLIHPNLSDHNIHKLLKQNKLSIDTFQNINKNSYKNDMLYCTNIEQFEVEKIKQKHKELKKLETNIISLNELYIELAYVIKKRKNLINNIEDNVYQVKNYTEDALHNIVEAKRYNTIIKKKILYFSIFLLIVAFIILCPVLFNYSLF